MFKGLQRWSPQLLSLMRLAVGITFVEHGTQKLLGFPLPAPGALGIFLLLFTGILETVAGTLLTVGLMTRMAAFLLSGELAVGYWWMHAPRSPYPMANGGEAMVLYCFVFLYIAAAGPGPWSLDALQKRVRSFA
ncbi:MAG: putative oxidoreductase [Alphaproteobacteria bacterium]|jgi:putative oxidoreductase|nr:putative oxidoreductase [Alphaproteobacteria bacterium]